MKIELVARKRNKVKNTTYSDAVVYSYLWKSCRNNPQFLAQLQSFGLASFHILVQNLDVTFVEKCLSLANHYIRNTPDKVSRHLYDIYCMWHFGNQRVYNLWAVIEATKACLTESFVDVALRGDKSFRTYLIELLQSDYYYTDYMQNTIPFVFNNVGITYQACKNTLLGILGMLNDF